VISDFILGKRDTKKKKEERIPAVGISFGLVPILACLNEKVELKEGVTDVLIVPLEKEISLNALILANTLRKTTEKNVEVFYEYSMKKAFKYCDYLEVEEIIFLGKRDIESKKYVLKNLTTKESKEYNL